MELFVDNPCAIRRQPDDDAFHIFHAPASFPAAEG